MGETKSSSKQQEATEPEHPKVTIVVDRSDPIPYKEVRGDEVSLKESLRALALFLRYHFTDSHLGDPLFDRELTIVMNKFFKFETTEGAPIQFVNAYQQPASQTPQETEKSEPFHKVTIVLENSKISLPREVIGKEPSLRHAMKELLTFVFLDHGAHHLSDMTQNKGLTALLNNNFQLVRPDGTKIALQSGGGDLGLSPLGNA